MHVRGIAHNVCSVTHSDDHSTVLIQPVPGKMRPKIVLLCFIDPRVRKFENEASSCPGIFVSTLRSLEFKTES